MRFHYAGLQKVISGGQTGADQAGIYVASEFQVETGGTIPKGWRTSAGPAPHMEKFGLIEHRDNSYPPRTRENVRNSDATVRLAANFATAGELLTQKYCRQENKLVHSVLLNGEDYERKGEQLAEWIKQNAICVLNVAGNRESDPPFIFEDACTVLRYAFSSLRSDGFLSTRGF